MTPIETVGPTGEFPDGKIAEDDSGELQFAIKQNPERNILVMEFGVAIKWMTLTKEQAIDVAETLLEMARGLK